MDDNQPPYEQAYEDYRKGLKTKEIAAKYGVSESTVRTWKKRYWSEKALQQNDKGVATELEKRCNAKKKAGAPKGNQNAKGNSGGGAPKGNKNRFVHGIYAMMPFSSLSPEQQAYMLDADLNPDIKLMQEIKAFDIRMEELWEIRNKEKAKAAGLSIKGVTKKAKSSGGEPDGQETITSTVSVNDIILKIEAEITRIQKEKTKTLAQIQRNKMEEKKLNISTSKLNIEQQKMVWEAERKTKDDTREDKEATIKITIGDVEF